MRAKLQPVSLEPAVQSAAREAQRLRRVAHVAVVASEGLLDEETLHLLQVQVFDRARPVVADRPQPEVSYFHSLPLRHQHRPLDRVVELADIAGPGIIAKRPRRGLLEPIDRLSIVARVDRKKVLRQRLDVAPAVAKRREADFEWSEAGNETSIRKGLADCDSSDTALDARTAATNRADRWVARSIRGVYNRGAP